jgi:hypothetical protein
VAIAKKKHHRKSLPRGPYPALGACPVFPPSHAAANAPSAGDESAWNQDISAAPLDPNSAAYISYIGAHGGDFLHPDFGSPRQYGFPYAVVGKRQKRTKVNFTAYGDESDHGAYRVPLKALVEGAQTSTRPPCSPWTARATSSTSSVAPLPSQNGLLTLLGAPRIHEASLERGCRGDLGPALVGARPDAFTSADAAGLPIFPGLVRYDEAAASHINHAIRITVSSTQTPGSTPPPLRGSTSSASAPADGLRLRAVGRLRHLRDHRPCARDRRRPEAVRRDRRRQRLELVSRALRTALVRRNLDQLKSIPGSAFQVVQSAAAIHHC